MSTADWNLITQTLNPNDSYYRFIDKFLKIHYEAFPLCKITMKTKNLNNSWITKEMKKSSRKKHCLYEKFLKSKAYKQYKALFEKIEERSKRAHYQKKLQKCENNI